MLTDRLECRQRVHDTAAGEEIRFPLIRVRETPKIETLQLLLRVSIQRRCIQLRRNFPLHLVETSEQ